MYPEIIAYRLNSSYRIIWSGPDYRILLVCFFPALSFTTVHDKHLIEACMDDGLVKHIARLTYINGVNLNHLKNTAILMFNNKPDRNKFIKNHNVTLVHKHEWDLATKLSQ